MNEIELTFFWERYCRMLNISSSKGASNCLLPIDLIIKAEEFLGQFACPPNQYNELCCLWCEVGETVMRQQVG